MTRGIWTKWIIGAAFLLLIIAAGCILWYQHTIAPYKQEAEQTDKLLKQWEADKAKPTITAETESTQAPAESTQNTAEKPPTDTTQDNQTPEQTNTEEVEVSPFGFGPYPKVPDDYPSGEVDWSLRSTPSGELLTRVLIKLWTEGERNFKGGGNHRGKVYPHYYDTVYLDIQETEYGHSVFRLSGPFVDFDTSTDIDNPPPHIRILDIKTSGIDPYQYLNLPRIPR